MALSKVVHLLLKKLKKVFYTIKDDFWHKKITLKIQNSAISMKNINHWWMFFKEANFVPLPLQPLLPYCLPYSIISDYNVNTYFSFI